MAIERDEVNHKKKLYNFINILRIFIAVNYMH
jgi:hypothetical protein